MTITTSPEDTGKAGEEFDEAAEEFDVEITAQALLLDQALTEAAGAGVRLEFLEPQYLLPNDINRVFAPEDLVDLLTSVPVVGFLQPAVVVPADPPAEALPGSGVVLTPGAVYHRVLLGHRRRATALQLRRRLPCLIVTTEDAAQEILAILAENDDRLALRPTEKADLYRQLTLMDWTPGKIAKARGVKPAEVRQALQLVGLPDALRAAADSGQLPLSLAPELAQLGDDPKALADVVKKGNQWGFRHAITAAVERKARKQAGDRLFADLVNAGVQILPKPAGFDDRSIKAYPVSHLTDADGEPVDEATVRTLPGFAAFIDRSGTADPRAVVFCLDPEKHGYIRAGHSRYLAEEQHKAAEAAKAARLAALTAAAGVRREFLVTHYGHARRAKTALPEAQRAAITNPSALAYAASFEELADAIAGASITDTVATASTDRLTRMLVARWVTSSEQNLTSLIAGRSWGVDAPAAVDYLDRLVGVGYALSDAEQQLHDEHTTPADTESDSDADTESDGETEIDVTEEDSEPGAGPGPTEHGKPAGGDEAGQTTSPDTEEDEDVVTADDGEASDAGEAGDGTGSDRGEQNASDVQDAEPGGDSGDDAHEQAAA